jgi:hypothetical protein
MVPKLVEMMELLKAEHLEKKMAVNLVPYWAES